MLTTGPLKLAFSFSTALMKLTPIKGAVSVLKGSFSMLDAIFKGSFICGTVRERFFAFSMLQIVSKSATVSALGTGEDSLSFSFRIQYFTFIATAAREFYRAFELLQRMSLGKVSEV